MKINNVSFGAQLVLDKSAEAFIKKQNPKEAHEFWFDMGILGQKTDVVEISNLTEHNTVKLDTQLNLSEDFYSVYSVPVASKYTADVDINGTKKHVIIESNPDYPTNLPLKQIYGVVYNHITKTKPVRTYMCDAGPSLKSYERKN